MEKKNVNIQEAIGILIAATYTLPCISIRKSNYKAIFREGGRERKKRVSTQYMLISLKNTILVNTTNSGHIFNIVAKMTKFK